MCCITTQNTQISLPTVNIIAYISLLSWLMHRLRYLKTDELEGLNKWFLAQTGYSSSLPYKTQTVRHRILLRADNGRSVKPAIHLHLVFSLRMRGGSLKSLLIHLHAIVFQLQDNFIFYLNIHCRHHFHFIYSPENETMEGAARWNDIVGGHFSVCINR